MNTTARLRQAVRNRPWIAEVLVLSAVLALAVALGFSRLVRASYDHDEDQFIASARLLADRGLLPYRDYPFFHTPYLTFVYSLILPLTGTYNLLGARLFSLLCSIGAILVLILITRDLFRSHSLGIRLWAQVGLLFLLLPSPLFADANQRGWNHGLAVLFTLLAFSGCYFSWRRRNTLWWLFAAGLCLGVAVGARLSLLTALPAFLVAILLFAPRGRAVWRPLLTLLGGFLAALTPMLVLFLVSPESFLFGNLGYARLNTLYRFDIPAAFGPMTLPDKFTYLRTDVIGQQPTLLLFLSYTLAITILGYRLWRGRAPRFEMALVLLMAPCVAVGSFLPTPSWYQYFFAPVFFALIAIAFALAYLTRLSGRRATAIMVAFSQLVILANIYGLEDYRRMSFLLHPDQWRPLMFHKTGSEIREALEAFAPGGSHRVLTLGPLFPLEAGLDIYPAFATGPFAWRTSPYLDAESRKALGVISAEDLEAYLADSPPDGILVGFASRLENALEEYAQQRGYSAVEIDSDYRLWIRPTQNAP